MHKKRFALFIFMLFGCAVELQAQDVFNPWKMPSEEVPPKATFLRKVLNMFSAGVYAGYGENFYKAKVSNFTILEDSIQGTYLIPGNTAAGTTTGYAQWMSNPTLVDTLVQYPYTQLIALDSSTSVVYKGRKGSIPITVTLQFNYKDFWIGGGATFERTFAPVLSPVDSFATVLPIYKPYDKGVWFSKFYGLAGYRFYHYGDYSFAAELEYGVYRQGVPYNKVAVTNSKYLNVGFPIEKNLSKYFRIVLKPSFDFKNWDTDTGEGIIPVNMNSFQLQLGVNINFPLYRNCPIKACKTQVEHAHGGKMYRGQPIYKVQNPKVGQNHRELLMNKKSIWDIFKKNE